MFWCVSFDTTYREYFLTGEHVFLFRSMSLRYPYLPFTVCLVAWNMFRFFSSYFLFLCLLIRLFALTHSGAKTDQWKCMYSTQREQNCKINMIRMWARGCWYWCWCWCHCLICLMVLLLLYSVVLWKQKLWVKCVRNIHMTGQWCQMVSGILPSYLRFIIWEEKEKNTHTHYLFVFYKIVNVCLMVWSIAYSRCGQFRFGFSSFYGILFLFPWYWPPLLPTPAQLLLWWRWLSLLLFHWGIFFLAWNCWPGHSVALTISPISYSIIRKSNI